MNYAAKTASVADKVPKLLGFSAAALECVHNQFLWKMRHLSSSMLMRGLLQRAGVPKARATAIGMWYEKKTRSLCPAVAQNIIPKRATYQNGDTLGEALKKVWVGYFTEPQDIVRAALVIAKHGECEEIGTFLSCTQILPRFSHKVCGEVYVNFTQSKDSGAMIGVCVEERSGGVSHQRVVLSVVNNEVRKATFASAQGEWVHAILDAARRMERPQDRVEWTQRHATRFDLALGAR